METPDPVDRFTPIDPSAMLPRAEETEEAVVLTGGRITAGIVRVGETVRRPATPASRFVADLLVLLEHGGFDGAPRYLRREGTTDVLSYLSGEVPARFRTWSDQQVSAAGSLLRALHDATRNSALAGSFPVVCHHDCGPNNVVFRDGLPYAFIDFDTAAPGLPLEDVGYMLCKRNTCPSVLCLSDWSASQLPSARSFGGPNPPACRVHRAAGPAAVHDAAVPRAFIKLAVRYEATVPVAAINEWL
ncbi:phosphotransferase family protein [Streptomyces mirabilis]|uniref:phosphotransferase family protein n=1 Tax=Streptomyces mirabilis TaxID=68239 RepID=UPI0033A925F3